MSYVIGIDPSLVATGYVVVGDGKVVDQGVFNTDPSALRVERLLIQQQRVRDLCTRYPPQVVAMEAEVWMSAGAQSSDQGAVQAMYQTLLYTLHEQWRGHHPRVRFLSVNVSHVKKWVGAKEKDQILLQVYKRYHVELMDHNIADAYILAMIGDAFRGYALQPVASAWPDMTQPQFAVLDTLLESGLVWEHPPERGKKGRRARREERKARRTRAPAAG